MHHSNRIPRRLATAAAVIAAIGVLAGCSKVVPGTADSSAASQVALAAVDDAFAGAASSDGSDLAPASVLAGAATTAVGTQSVAPLLVVRRSGMQRQRRLLSLVFDGRHNPPTAEAQVWIKITGSAQILQMYPVAGAPVKLLGSKPIDMEGTVTFDLRKGADGWRLADVTSAGIKQGSLAAAVSSVSFDPDPLLTGRADNVVYVSLSEPAASDDFLVVARGRYLRPHGVLGDNGVPPDLTANDELYSGFAWVGTAPRLGSHLAFVSALDYSRTVDLGKTAGAYDAPYTDTLQPVLVKLASGG